MHSAAPTMYQQAKMAQAKGVAAYDNYRPACRHAEQGLLIWRAPGAAPGSMMSVPCRPSTRNTSSEVSRLMPFWMPVSEGNLTSSCLRLGRPSNGSGRQWCELSYLLVRLTSCKHRSTAKMSRATLEARSCHDTALSFTRCGEVLACAALCPPHSPHLNAQGTVPGISRQAAGAPPGAPGGAAPPGPRT